MDGDFIYKSLEEIKESQEKMRDNLGDINVTLQKQYDSLEEHKRRSEANEKMIEIVARELKPVQEHVIKVQFVFKVFTAGVAFLAACATLVRLLVLK